MIILKVTKNQCFTISLEDTFFEKPQGRFKLTPSHFRIKITILDLLLLFKSKSSTYQIIFLELILDSIRQQHLSTTSQHGFQPLFHF